jgi:hypothetical protein
MRTFLGVTFAIAAGCGGSTKQPVTPVSGPQPIANVAPEPAPPPEVVADEPPPPVEDDPPTAEDDEVPTAGVLGSTDVQQGGSFASLTGTGDISSGFDDTNIYGGLLGNEATTVDVKPGKLTTKGRLGKSIIRRKVKKSLDQIIACYEQHLSVDPALAGTLEARFTIEADGTVSAATASGVHTDVGTCVAEVIKGIRFPKPKKGTVQVTYPFELSSNGAMAGGFGFGRAGFGPGGGGTGWGTIGTGRYGTIGHGSGTGTGYGAGGGRGGMRGRTSAVPKLRLGQPTITGNLDAAIVRRYVKRNIQKISYCYEKQLLATPGLAGTVSTKFTIDTDGKVSASTADGVDAEVSGCVAGVLGGIEFPRPKDGGTVQVAYPFEFAPSGG